MSPDRQDHSSPAGGQRWPAPRLIPPQPVPACRRGGTWADGGELHCIYNGKKGLSSPIRRSPSPSWRRGRRPKQPSRLSHRLEQLLAEQTEFVPFRQPDPADAGQAAGGACPDEQGVLLIAKYNYVGVDYLMIALAGRQGERHRERGAGCATSVPDIGNSIWWPASISPSGNPRGFASLYHLPARAGSVASWGISSWICWGPGGHGCQDPEQGGCCRRWTTR